MGATAAVKLRQVLDNAETVVALELLGAAQALDFLHPMRAGAPIEAAHAALRECVPFLDRDRLLRDDIEQSLACVRAGRIAAAAEGAGARLHRW